jgi:hypothetical protein
MGAYLRDSEATRSTAGLMISQETVRLHWRPSAAWAIYTAALAALGFISISRGGEFLYWQF